MVLLRINKFYVKPLSHFGWKNVQKIEEKRFKISPCDNAAWPLIALDNQVYF